MFEEVIIVVVGFDEFCVLRYFIVGAIKMRLIVVVRIKMTLAF